LEFEPIGPENFVSEGIEAKTCRPCSIICCAFSLTLSLETRSFARFLPVLSRRRLRASAISQIQQGDGCAYQQYDQLGSPDNPPAYF
jgi:hypothetical protein